MTDNSGIIATVGRGSTSQTIFVSDLISEGPIAGLVNGEASVYLDEVSVMDPEEAAFLAFNAQTVTFSGSSTGTFNGTIPDISLNTETFRYLNLEGVDSLTGIELTHVSGTNQLTRDVGDFTAYTTHGETSDLKKSARLVKDNVSIIGTVDSAGVFISKYPMYTSFTGSGYTLFIDESFEITAITNSTVTISSAPPSKTYEFDIGRQEQVSDSQASSSPSSTQKVNNTDVQFRRGDQVQDPLSEVGGVGSSPAFAGTTTLTNPTLKQINNPLAYGLPDHYPTNGYPEGHEGALDDVFATISSAPLTPAQKAEVDEIRIAINYSSMMATSENSGNQIKNSAIYDFSIKTQLNGVWTEFSQVFPGLVTHNKKTSSPVSFEHTIQLEAFRPFDNFEIRIIRLTRAVGVGVRSTGYNVKSRYKGGAESSVGTPMFVFKEKFSYPYTAYAGVTFSSENYASLPQRTYDCRGLLVKIPTTYTTREKAGSNDPEDLYSGFWNGSFKAEKEYTDNPAWIFYDIVSNNRYGAGEWITEADLNEYALYRIARYCDELVDDGNGGWEPRFRANVYLTKAQDVYKVLKDMATIFTGMLYFLEGQVTAVMDSPSDPVYNFSKGNVIEGQFNYESTGSKTRVNQVVVTWNNPNNNYTQEALIVEDRNAIIRNNKIVSQNSVAFGATSEGQATRYGRWKLYTAQYQTEVVSFKTSLSAGFLQPGDVITIQDADRYGISLSGRTQAGNSTTQVNLDRTITLRAGYNYELSVLITEPACFLAQDAATISGTVYNKGDKIAGITTESAATSVYADLHDPGDELGPLVATTWKPYTNTETRAVNTAAGDVSALTVYNTSTGRFSIAPDAETIWLLKEYEASGTPTVHGSRNYRILAIIEEAKNEYSITAVEHFNEKYDAIDKDYALGEIPDETFPSEGSGETVPAPPNLYVLTVSDWTKPNEEIELQWDEPDFDFIDGYEIKHNIGGEDTTIRIPAGRTVHRFNKVVDGDYLFRIRTVSSRGNVSGWVAVSLTVDDPFGANVARSAGGIAQGAISSVSAFIDANNNYRFEKAVYALAPIQTPFDPYISTGTLAEYSASVADIPVSSYVDTDALTRFASSFFILFDYENADKLRLVSWDTSTFSNLHYWYDAGTGAQAPTFYTLTGGGTISIPISSNRVTGTGTDFTTDLQVGDILQVATGVAAKVVSIVSDTFLIIDRSFSVAYTGETPKSTTLQVNFETDCLIARIYNDGAFVYDNYLTIDPDLATLAKFVNIDSNVQFINYNAAEEQETVYANITLDATATNFAEPEFQITGAGFSQVDGSADAGWTAGVDGVYNKVIHSDSSDIPYSSGSSLVFEVEVREGNDPDNDNKKKTAGITIGKVIGGSVGVDAKTAQITASDYSVVYDAEGENPSFTGSGGDITLTAVAQGFDNPEYKFTGGDTVFTDETVYKAGNTALLTVPTNYFGESLVLRVSIKEVGTPGEVAYDNISISAVKPGTQGYTVILSNEAHSAPADPDGTISPAQLAGSGATIEVFKGATALTYVLGLPGIGEFGVASGTNAGLTPTQASFSGETTTLCTIADFTDMDDDSEVLEYTINAENISTGIIKKQSFSKSRVGQDGTDGTDGTNGTNGTNGDDALRTATGVLYYQTTETSSPGQPPGGTFNFNSGLPSVSGWSMSPPTLEGGTTKKVWHCFFTVEESYPGSGSGSMSYGTTAIGQVMTGLVSFQTDGNGDRLYDGAGGGGLTQIYGGDIKTNTIKAAQLEISNSSAGGNGIYMDGSGKVIEIYDGGTLRVKLGQL